MREGEHLRVCAGALHSGEPLANPGSDCLPVVISARSPCWPVRGAVGGGDQCPLFSPRVNPNWAATCLMALQECRSAGRCSPED